MRPSRPEQSSVSSPATTGELAHRATMTGAIRLPKLSTLTASSRLTSTWAWSLAVTVYQIQSAPMMSARVL